MVGCDGSLLVLRGCDTETINSYLPSLQSKHQNDSAGGRLLVALDCVGGTAADGVYNLSQYYMSLCRKYGLLPNERSTLLSSIDQLIVLQLCLAEKNKQERGEYDVETSTVIQNSKDIIKFKMADTQQQEPEILATYQTFLKHCNYVDMCDLYQAVVKAGTEHEALKAEIADVDFMLISLPDSVVETAMVRYLCKGRKIQSVSMEVPLESESGLEGENLLSNLNICYSDMTLEEMLREDFNTSFSKNTPRTGVSLTQSYVQLVFVSYLELLVNSRSELALARSINTPERELTHAAFTDLKHAANEKGMTMYQTAVSFVMKLRLGGKGYAPDLDNPLAQHVKGLGEFVSFVQRLQTIIEEDLDKRSSCRRVLNVIKKEIVKCKDNRLRTSSVESVCASLQSEVVRIIDMLDKLPASCSPKKAVRDGGSMVGRHTLKVLGYIVDKLVSGMDKFKMQTLDFLCDGFSSQATPVRFPCILSQFTSPDEDPDSPESQYNKSLSERLLGNSEKKLTPLHKKRYKSSLSWAEPGNMVDINKEEQIFLQQKDVFIAPSKTLVQPGTKTNTGKAWKVAETMKDQENCLDISSQEVSQAIQSDKPDVSETKAVKKSLKRPIESDISSQVSKKSKKEKSCKRKLLPQVKGQQQLTRFFRV